MEIWDLYDINENLTDKEWKRSESHLIPEGFYHLVCEILVRHADGDFLIMQRDFSKKQSPGHWEASAGGSVLKGENILSCAARELFEETGIKANDFIEIGSSTENDKHGIYHSFLTIVDCPKNCVVLQEGETINFKWISTEEFIEYMKTDQLGEDQKERYAAYVNSLENPKQAISK